MTQSRQIDPRAAMWQRLPRWIQGLLTELTGKAAPEELETFRHTTATRLSMTLAQFSIGIIGSAWLVHVGGLALSLLPITILMTAGAARAFQTTYVHQASHGNLSTNHRLNDFLGELTSVLGWLAPLPQYGANHTLHHNKLATAVDPDLQMVLELFDFKTGLTRREYWAHLRKLLVSPKLHLALTLTRLCSNLVTATGWRRLASWAHGLGLLIFVATTGLWLEFAVAYLLPMGPMFTIGAVLQTLSEHTWVHTGQGRDPKRLVLSRLTRDRFFGEMPPDSDAGWHPWAKWWARMLFIHAPSRIWIVPLDLANHAWHHSNATDRNWPRSAFARRDDESRAEMTGTPYLEVWGLANALNLTFDHLSLVPPGADLGKPKTYGWIDPDLLGM